MRIGKLTTRVRSSSLDRLQYEAIGASAGIENGGSSPRGSRLGQRRGSVGSLGSSGSGDDDDRGLLAGALGSGSSDMDHGHRRLLHRGVSSVQGSLANILPVLADSEDEDGKGGVAKAKNGHGSSFSRGGSLESIGIDITDDQVTDIDLGRPRLGSPNGLLDGDDYFSRDGRSGSERSLGSFAASLKAKIISKKGNHGGGSVELHRFDSSNQGDDVGKLRTPGQIRTAVLEWMYEENGVMDCPDLAVQHINILEDLIVVFVCVVLHGKSDRIRSRVWRFLIEGSTHSLHFAVLVISNLNASCHQQPEPVDEDESSLEHKGKRTKDLALIEKAITTLKKESLAQLRASQIEGGRELKLSIVRVLEHLETVHDNQVLTNLDLNQRGRTSRQNIDMLVSKVRNALVKHHTSEEDERLEDLDGKLGFIKTLTDLDDWLIKNVPREGRRAALIQKLQSLAIALPHGAYLPTAVGDATERHRVLRIALDETIVFNTAQKCPFLLVAEVEPILGDDHDLLEAHVPTRVHPLSRMTTDGSSDTGLDSQDDNHNDENSFRHSQKNSQEGSDIAEKQVAQEKWEDMQERIRRSSPFGNRPSWKLASMFVKSGDDLRQQQLGILFVSTFQKIFLEEGVPVWLSPYKVIATGPRSGLLEPARNSDSIARIKERGGFEGIDQYFLSRYGSRNSRGFKRAQKNFLQSLAGYSIVAYLIKLHDRHNGNILLDLEGHCLHIDFGFMLGYSHKLERSPFKLTDDMVAVLDGPHSPTFQKFRRLMEKAYIAANKHERELVLLAELMSVDESSSACFAGGRRWVIDEFRARFNPGLTTRKLRAHINDIIDASLLNFYTTMYDRFQRCVNGIW